MRDYRVPSRPDRSAFTLIEVLVVVAIIALLAAVLLPSLRRARDQAKAVVCLANMKSVGNGISFYNQDSKKYLPPYRFIRPRPGLYPVPHMMNMPDWTAVISYKYLHNNYEVFECPSDDFIVSTSPAFKRGPSPDLVTSSPNIFYSYAINAVFPKQKRPITTNPGDVFPALVPSEMAPPDYWGIIERFNPGVLDWVKDPARTMFATETREAPMLNPRRAETDFGMRHGTDDRRTGMKTKTSVLFADTHGELTTFEKIYPADFTKFPLEHLGPASGWPAFYRQLWYGDPDATYIVRK